MGEWIETVLANMIDIKHGYAFKGTNIVKEETDKILVTPGNFHIGGGFKSDKFKYFNDEHPAGYVLNAGQIIVTMTDLSKEGDTLGYSARVPHIEGKILLHNQRIGLVEFCSDDLDKDFIYWTMRTRPYQWFVLGSATGTSVRHTSPSRIKEYSFLAPKSVFEQKEVAEVLSSLDDKIDLLHRQNKTLEALAETLFRHTFIDNAQDDWEEKPLKEICKIRNGYAFKSPTYQEDGQKIVRTLNFSNGLVDLNNMVYISEDLAKEFDKYYLDRKDLLLVMVGASLGNFSIVTDDILPALQNQNMWCFKALNPQLQHYLNYALRYIVNDNLHSASGSARQFFQKTAFYEFLMKVPDKDTLEVFDNSAEAFFSKVEVNKKQISSLENLRDTLLPKLMSGDVRVQYDEISQTEAA